MKSGVLAVGLLLFAAQPNFVFPQTFPRMASDSTNIWKQLYEIRIMQLEFQIRQRPPSDSLVWALQKEAWYFARRQDWQTALELLNQTLNLFEEPLPENPASSSHQFSYSHDANQADFSGTGFPEGWQWSLEIGSDYSRQEYEMSFIESDSVVLEQFNNPYTAVRLFKIGKAGKRSYQVHSSLRGERELIQSGVSGALESMGWGNRWRLELQSDLFWQHQQSRGNFWENQFQGSWNVPLNTANHFSLYSLLRHKIHFPSDSSFGRILTADITAALRHYLQMMSWIEFSIRPSFYDENQILGLRYSQIATAAEVNLRTDFNRYFLLEAAHAYRSFRSRQPGEDDINQFQALRPLLEAETPFLQPFGVAVRAEGEWRWYQRPNVTHSNFNGGAFQGMLKFYFGDYNALGAGYAYEFETHRTDQESEDSLVEQENFVATGLVVSADIMQLTGLLISFTYRLTFRTYPNAGANDLLGFYSNRRIHSLQALVSVPISSRWQFQLFANYDNDRDRDREANDNFSTIFNAGFIYKF